MVKTSLINLIKKDINMTDKKNIQATTKNKTAAEIISRKEALKKVGKYAAFTAAGMMLILKPTKSYAGSTPQHPGADW